MWAWHLVTSENITLFMIFLFVCIAIVYRFVPRRRFSVSQFHPFAPHGLRTSSVYVRVHCTARPASFNYVLSTTRYRTTQISTDTNSSLGIKLNTATFGILPPSPSLHHHLPHTSICISSLLFNCSKQHHLQQWNRTVENSGTARHSSKVHCQSSVLFMRIHRNRFENCRNACWESVCL